MKTMKPSPTKCTTDKSGLMAPANDNESLPSCVKDAIEAGATKYFTGEMCKQGHIAPRYTINRACVVCTYESKQRRKEADPELWKEITRAERKRAFERDPERVRSHTRNFMRRWREANPELSTKKMREWRASNPDRAKEHDANNNAKRRSAEGKHTAQDIREILARQKFKCAECGVSVRKRSNRHIDHIMPLALGGTNWPNNLQILCPSCNQHKHAKHPLEWAKMKGRLV